jgi:glyoxylase-like metal-dependent hydrolase (beta-lactamase superfamily II)
MDRERRASGHTHPDHIGGNTDANGHAVFARARCVLWRGEWSAGGTNEANLARLAAVFGEWVRRHPMPLRERVELP